MPLLQPTEYTDWLILSLEYVNMYFMLQNLLKWNWMKTMAVIFFYIYLNKM